MRHYTDAEERRIRLQGSVKQWARERLIEQWQTARLLEGPRVDLRRTNSSLRAGLAVFTAVVVAASVLLPLVALDLSGNASLAIVTGVAAILCLGLAEVFAGRYRFYEFGVEEMLAAASAVLLGVAAMLSWQSVTGGSPGVVARVIGLTVGACGGFGVYRRFGCVSTAAAGMICLAVIPFQFDISASIRHAAAASILTVEFLVVRPARLRHQDEWPGDEYGQLQAVAWLAAYVALNVQIGWDWDVMGRGFYWFTYAMTFVLPVVGLILSVRGKDRPLLTVSIGTAIITLVTNKPYLGWPRHEWDPILLGVVLIAVALGLRRWLLSGARGQRNGFTADTVVAQDRALLALLSAVPFGTSAHMPAHADSQPGFAGGRSGGAGGGGEF